ncbi:N-acetylneuraminate synthase family protein [Nitrosopumilus sp.]|uniref:N-acetylneuraminate synthase family protein n=1 Tax=Nitrosopumilus sp. TaxID=2024843 RepID=UPI0034A09D07
MTELDNPNHVFVIAEAGSNWKCGTFEEDLQCAKHLIEIAAKSGADAVKFQIYRPETLYAENAGQSDYLSEKGMNQEINDIFKNLSMPYEMIPQLADYSKQHGIEFMSTPFSVKDAVEVNPYVSIHKIASYEINHVRLLEFLAKTKKPIIISTGASTFEEIDFAVNLLKKNGNEHIKILQCTSKYPCPIKALNLSVIPKINSRYDLPVGLSDHSIDPILAPIMAVAFGAIIIEKHFTMDRTLPGPDHPFALIPNELEMMVKAIRNAELAKGSGDKQVLNEELELKQFATRSLQALKPIKKGETLVEGVNFDVLRPGKRSRGIESRFLESVNGKKSKIDVDTGDGITDFE